MEIRGRERQARGGKVHPRDVPLRVLPILLADLSRASSSSSLLTLAPPPPPPPSRCHAHPRPCLSPMSPVWAHVPLFPLPSFFSGGGGRDRAHVHEKREPRGVWRATSLPPFRPSVLICWRTAQCNIPPIHTRMCMPSLPLSLPNVCRVLFWPCVRGRGDRCLLFTRPSRIGLFLADPKTPAVAGAITLSRHMSIWWYGCPLFQSRLPWPG